MSGLLALRKPAVCSFSQLIPLLHSVVCLHVFLSFHGLLTEPLFVARLGHLAAASATFLKQLRKEVAIPVFVKDQFALGWCGVLPLCLVLGRERK